MRNKLKILLLSAFMTSMLFSNAYAGEWKENETGWWYENTDGTYLKSGWYWINGKCYYFDAEGYILTDTLTPDKNTVDETGAWTKNGEVQIRDNNIKLNSLTVTIPNGYRYDLDEKSLTLDDYSTTTSIMTVNYEGLAKIQEQSGEEGLIEVSDEVVEGILGTVTTNIELQEQSVKTFNEKNWNYYKYTTLTLRNEVADCEIYTSYEGQEIRIVVFTGKTSREFTSNDEFMTKNIK